VSKLSVPGLKLLKNVRTAERPRTLDISPDGTVLYLVNYTANQINVLNTENLKTLQTINTCWRPIGITYEAVKNRVWVACYSGQILLFDLVRSE
jgi:YVTN family beta-propeller protein